MGNIKINDGVVIDHTPDGWGTFKKWLDGTYASLRYTWVDEGEAYNIVAMDGPFYHTCSINKADATEFETTYKVYQPAVVMHNGCPQTCLDAPQEDDHRYVFINSPGREGSYTWITSRGDDPNPTPPASGRGEGNQSLLSFTGPDTLEVEINFNEATQLLGGNVYWRDVANWGFEDSWNLLVRLPATVATPNVGNTGNCNLVPTGFGFNIILPAAGDGAYDVDLATVIPVPDGYSPASGSGAGFWNVDRYWSEAVTANADAKGEFNLYDTPLEFFFCKNVSCGNPLGYWELKPFKAEWISSRWVAIFKATRVTAGAGKIGGFFHIYRPGAT